VRPTLLRRESAAAPALATPEAERLGQPAPSDDLVWGRHAALAVLESGRPVHRIWCTPELRFSPKFLQQLREAKASGVLVEEVTWARLGQLTAGAVHQGIVLQTAAADTLDLDSLIEGCGGIGEAPLLMALDGITDPHNLGAIARSAEALGAHGLVLPQRRSAGLTGSVAKVAAGALEHLPVTRVVNLNRALERLKQEGYRVVGLASEGSVSLEHADLDGPLVIVTGSEGDGLSMLTRRHCDQLVSIPLRGATPSLNASVASALLLYEVARRGWMHGLRGGDPAPRLLRPQLPAPPPSALPAAPGPDQISEPDGEPDGQPDAVTTPPLSAEDPVQAEVWAPAPALAEPETDAPLAAEPETLVEVLAETEAEANTPETNTPEENTPATNTAELNTEVSDPALAASPVSTPQPSPDAQPSDDPAPASVPAFSGDVDLGSLQL
jgi:23S rRNA (guanosine2251-2'-O)-methyltransferase